MEQTSVTRQAELSSLTSEVVAVDKQSESFREFDRFRVTSEPVLTQPGLGITTTTVTTITQTGGDWSTGLLDVCADRNTCIVGGLVPCCLDLNLAHHFGECLCLPLLPGSTFAMRVGIRERYKIRQGSVCEDWASVCCCYCPALCQMSRETKLRMKTRTYHVTTALESS
ncbi:PLAC8-like protein 1 isoform X1 [Synchiropus splendidus]|uniref:PLAC8-like protein 1 isoform X1 n=1 Tax=Synchiropus splendidus TaxID=270530 RepID=UPI00237E6359|nr:PLAC8-like protein 1 isoform X1 [Synchiropus splendidus]XP_053703584.1 PLAC8-like protein 1 isoform X1 [Synchiropus splendidus]XP_053703585.1 PLAC8-like protein 1 isoform X1 [Synchiropus splendidus]